MRSAVGRFSGKLFSLGAILFMLAGPKVLLAAPESEIVGSDITYDHVTACGVSLELYGTVDYVFAVVVDAHGGWHRTVVLREDVSGEASPGGDVYSGSILIRETSELIGGDSDDSWPFNHTFRRLVQLRSPTGPTITVQVLYYVVGTPDERIVVERRTRVERCR